MNYINDNRENLTLFYITNNPKVALIAEKYGVDRIWIDLEVLGKEARQRNLDTVKSKHHISDISTIRPLLSKSELMVRINSWYVGSIEEIELAINAGADIIMLPYWKTVSEVNDFLKTVNERCKTSLLLETKEAVNCIDEVLKIPGIDEIHIGLNDLHLSYGKTFMFELLSDGTVEELCNKISKANIPYGFGGIAKLGDGLLPAEKIIMEHYRLGSTRAILSREFCDSSKIANIEIIDSIFKKNMESLRKYEADIRSLPYEAFIENKMDVAITVNKIVSTLKNCNI